MEIEKLSKDDERRIVGALEDAIRFTNAGAVPNDALQKVAEDNKFPPEIVRRMTEAYNTSRTLAHLKAAKAEEKGNSFPLADAQVILDRMYPRLVVSPVKSAQLREVPAEYGRPEERDFFKKTAEALPRVKIDPYPESEWIQSHQLFDRKLSMVKEADALKSSYRQAIWKLDSLVKEASDYFGRMDRLPFKEVERNMVAEFGEVAKPLMDMVYTRAQLKEARLAGPARRLMFDLREEPYPVLVGAIDSAKQAAARASEVVDSERRYVQFMKEAGLPLPPEPVKEACLLDDLLLGKVHRPFEDNPLLPGAVKEAEEVQVEMGGPAERPFAKGALLGSIADNAETAVMGALGLSDPKAEGAMGRAVSEASDPIHESRLRTIGVQAMLNDFMANDPIISGYDPDQITAAYNQFSQLSPNVAQQPAVARAVLRNMLQSEALLQPHEAGQLVELNRELQERSFAPQIGAIGGRGKR